MSLNDGKQEIVYHEFLGKKYRIDALPCGVSIPFNIEINKIRKNALLTISRLKPDTPSSRLYYELDRYYEDHPEEAYKQILQMAKAVSVLTEFFTKGDISEEYIKNNADDEDLTNFINAVQEVDQDKKLKKLKVRKMN